MSNILTKWFGVGRGAEGAAERAATAAEAARQKANAELDVQKMYQMPFAQNAGSILAGMEPVRNKIIGWSQSMSGMPAGTQTTLPSYDNAEIPQWLIPGLSAPAGSSQRKLAEFMLYNKASQASYNKVKGELGKGINLDRRLAEIVKRGDYSAPPVGWTVPNLKTGGDVITTPGSQYNQPGGGTANVTSSGAQSGFQSMLQKHLTDNPGMEMLGMRVNPTTGQWEKQVLLGIDPTTKTVNSGWEPFSPSTPGTANTTPGWSNMQVGGSNAVPTPGATGAGETLGGGLPSWLTPGIDPSLEAILRDIGNYKEPYNASELTTLMEPGELNAANLANTMRNTLNMRYKQQGLGGSDIGNTAMTAPSAWLAGQRANMKAQGLLQVQARGDQLKQQGIGQLGQLNTLQENVKTGTMNNWSQLLNILSGQQAQGLPYTDMSPYYNAAQNTANQQQQTSDRYAQQAASELAGWNNLLGTILGAVNWNKPSGTAAPGAGGYTPQPEIPMPRITNPYQYTPPMYNYSPGR